MNVQRRPKFTLSRFDEDAFLIRNADARALIASGEIANAAEYLLRHGGSDPTASRLKQEPAAIKGGIDRFYVSENGHVLILGWLADEGCGEGVFKLFGSDFNVEIPGDCVYRHARQDVEAIIREGSVNYGFMLYCGLPARDLLKQPVLLKYNTKIAGFQTRIEPEIISDKRMLDTALIFLRTSQSHRSKEYAINRLIAGYAGASLCTLFQNHVAANCKNVYVERFNPRKVERSFVSVLFGSTEPMLMQPGLFAKSGVDFGEWIYVCNSPEDAPAMLRLGRFLTELYDVSVTVIVMGDNVGFGAANNVAIANAAGEDIFIINPDVYPIAAHNAHAIRAITATPLGDNLWGGLLFYDDHNLMHSGMFFDADRFTPGGEVTGAGEHPDAVKLFRVEHFDKGVPFDEGRWSEPHQVPAISGAVMAFRKPLFEKIGGFSVRYIYGHYEDADLSVRWADSIAPVMINPDLRLVHLEGQGSRARGEQYGAAAMVNRHLFSLEHHAQPTVR